VAVLTRGQPRRAVVPVHPWVLAARSDSALGRIRGVLRRAHPAFGDRLPVQHDGAGRVRDLVVAPPAGRLELAEKGLLRLKRRRGHADCHLRCADL